MGRLAGKTAFVTAAAQGIGRATALAFAAEGARVVATDHECRQAGGDRGTAGLETAALDATDPAAITAMGERVGAIDILFNCAGFVHQGSVLDATEAEWEMAFELNVRSMFRTIRAFLPGMVAQRRRFDRQHRIRRQQREGHCRTASSMAPAKRR